MLAGRVSLLAGALALTAASPAAAGGCCYGCGCGPVFAPPSEMLIVNQGPVASGPGPYVMQAPGLPPSGFYPYVGFVYSGEPYGFTRPWVGAPPVFYWPRDRHHRYYGVVRMYR
jgi:hypothetical protein